MSTFSTVSRSDLDALLRKYRPFVCKLARSYANESVSYEALVQEGLMGVWRASEDHNPEKSCFLTYARYWIRQKMARAIQDQSHMIALPAYVFGYISKLKREIQNIQDFGGDVDVDVDRLMDGFGWSPRRKQIVRDVFASMSVKSIDASTGSGNGDTIARTSLMNMSDSLSVINDESVRLDMNVVSDALNVALDSLSDEERKVVKMRHMMGFKLDGIGVEIGRSKEGVRQIDKRAIRKLK